MNGLKWGMVGLVGLLIIAGLVIQTTATAPSDTRMIVDHTKNVYVSPPCYDDAELTNNLEELTLEGALATGYEPESACTTDSLQGESQPLILSLFGVGEEKWDW
ncbi:hypothetical protein [Halalkalibacterium ligniniphilum]|uniref:hypothetical protein n=1 Tax=Halalkalibacterium ligniniphilum TaxID=1134413 RepID=UPI00034A9CD4|nr:hypothetical protein [Halalkalibacterium ligniniphilum]